MIHSIKLIDKIIPDSFSPSLTKQALLEQKPTGDLKPIF